MSVAMVGRPGPWGRWAQNNSKPWVRRDSLREGRQVHLHTGSDDLPYVGYTQGSVT